MNNAIVEEGFIVNGLLWSVDPLNKFSEEGPRWIFECCGLIPHFLHAMSDHDAKTQFDASYGFGLHPMEGGTVHEDGRYSYPEDPDLYPLMQTRVLTPNDETEIVRIYHYGIVAITNPFTGSTFVTRMD